MSLQTEPSYYDLHQNQALGLFSPFPPFLYTIFLNDKQHASLPTLLARDMACRAIQMILLLLQTL